jgi:hypothetical protein
MRMQTIPEAMTTTNIRVDVKTKDKVSALGKHGDSFNSILVMLLYEHDLLAAIAKDHPDIVQHKQR